jgi:NMD protein affecting ribosome stability and mRNA decay
LRGTIPGNLLSPVSLHRESSAKQLISQDDKSNIKNYKFTLFAEIAPICKDDLCILDPKLAQLLGAFRDDPALGLIRPSLLGLLLSGGVSPLMVCHKVSAALHMIDPVTLKFVEIQ